MTTCDVRNPLGELARGMEGIIRCGAGIAREGREGKRDGAGSPRECRVQACF